MERIIIKYLQLVIFSFIIRFLVLRFLLEFSIIKKFFYMREMLPCVRNWNSRIKMIYYCEIFSFIQSLLIAFYFMVFCHFISLNEFLKIFISFLLYFTFIIIEKLRFAITLTNYPTSLLLMDTFIYLFIGLLQFMAMGFILFN